MLTDVSDVCRVWLDGRTALKYIPGDCPGMYILYQYIYILSSIDPSLTYIHTYMHAHTSGLQLIHSSIWY